MLFEIQEVGKVVHNAEAWNLIANALSFRVWGVLISLLVPFIWGAAVASRLVNTGSLILEAGLVTSVKTMAKIILFVSIMALIPTILNTIESTNKVIAIETLKLFVLYWTLYIGLSYILYFIIVFIGCKERLAANCGKIFLYGLVIIIIPNWIIGAAFWGCVSFACIKQYLRDWLYSQLLRLRTFSARRKKLF